MRNPLPRMKPALVAPWSIQVGGERAETPRSDDGGIASLSKGEQRNPLESAR